MDIKGQGFEASIVATEQSNQWLIDAADEIFEAAQARGLELPSLAGTLAVSETLIPETTDLLTTLNPEQQERATGLQTVMVERFSTKETPLTPEDFGLVAVGEGESRKVIVMLTAGNGLYRGSYDQIMNDKKANQAAYIVKFDGQKIDTRQAMT